jgi:hypothetical protein
MDPNEDRADADYDIGSLTTSESKDVKKKPVTREVSEQGEQYTSGKPRRIIIRARITHD